MATEGQASGEGGGTGSLASTCSLCVENSVHFRSNTRRRTAAVLKIVNLQYRNRRLFDFAKNRCISAIWVPVGELFIKIIIITGTKSRNKPSVPAFLKFVFWDISRPRIEYTHVKFDTEDTVFQKPQNGQNPLPTKFGIANDVKWLNAR